ncbi:hyaluronan-binding protein 2-like [Tachysurus fulvidraco]|uniref:hyaluronan-binding protein 2-like n=1 Tax=Tachysurus fulvidraco TaxID=1234273 RepID=UPI001FEE6074|nr:hyaluronan-binding protein 2-like [Tachysurus fulvidraco]
MLSLLLLLLSLKTLNQPAVAAATAKSEQSFVKIKGVDEDPTPATNKTSEDYYEESYNGQTTTDSQWLYEFIEERDECEPNPCYNNGVCENDGDGDFKCTCPRPFKGKRCQSVINVCRNVKCGHGDCVFIETEPFYECNCVAPFQPPKCRRPSPCNPSPCLNGGTCVKGRTRIKFHCNCPANYSGKFCQVGPDDCYEGDGSSYRGFVSETESGQECMPWYSHLIAYIPEYTGEEEEEEEDDGIGSHNYCRNPDGENQPWCFIRYNNSIVWDNCNVKRCKGQPVLTTPEPVTEKVPVTTTLSSENDFSVCGKIWQSRIASRIFGGKKAKPGTHPWQVSLQTRRKNSTHSFIHSCGGIVLNSCWVLTAAHCIQEGKEMQVVLGGVDLDKHEAADQTLAVKSYIMHENYTEVDDVQYNDIALLKLKTVTEDGLCAKETKYVKSACLPPYPFPDGIECTISGYGVTEHDEQGSRQLLDTKVLLINQNRCMAPNVFGDLLDENMLCAGRMQGGIDACQGDSGGPLICNQNGTNYIYGIVSWGDGCGKKNKPGIYTRVTKFLDWISEKMRST